MHSEVSAYGELHLVTAASRRAPDLSGHAWFTAGETGDESLPLAGDADQVLARLGQGEHGLVRDSGEEPGGGLSSANTALVQRVCQAGFTVILHHSPAFGPPEVLGLLGEHSRAHLLRWSGKPRKEHKRQLQELRHDPYPVLLQLTAADRLGFVQECKEELGDRTACYWSADDQVLHLATLGGLLNRLDRERPGAAVLAVGGLDPADDALFAEAVNALIQQGYSRSDAARSLAARYNLSRSEAYERVMALSEERTPGASNAGHGGAADSVLRFSFKGHPRLRGTHHKTLEFKRDEELSEKETCVVGVAARWSPEEIKRLRGKVRVTLQVGDLQDSFDAEVCMQYNARDRMVFRKSGKQSRITFGVSAGKGASDLSRALIKALARPGAEGTVTITAF